MDKKEHALKVYKDRRNWTPPSYSMIAKKVGISKTLAYYYINGRDKNDNTN